MNRNALVFLRFWFCSGLFSYSTFAGAGPEFDYFKDPKLRFWNEQPVVKPDLQPVVKTFDSKSGTATDSANTQKFQWQKYLDPKNDDFFKEGDYTPPAPFMEIARNPSDENIRNWFKYLETKNELARTLQKKLESFAKRESSNAYADVSKQQTAQMLNQAAMRVASMAVSEPIAKDYSLRMYFDSKCPHCEHMMETLAVLMHKGFYVELRRIDHGSEFKPKYPFPVQQATAAEIAQAGIEAVPVLLVGNLKNRTVFRIQGYQTPEAVISAIQEAKLHSQTIKEGKSS